MYIYALNGRNSKSLFNHGQQLFHLCRNGICVTMLEEVKVMEKTATLNLRVNPEVKQRAEEVLKSLGMPMSTAIDIYLNQISLTGGIPFAVTLPKAPASIDATRMTADEIHEKLGRGYQDAMAGRTRDAKEAFAAFRAENK